MIIAFTMYKASYGILGIEEKYLKSEIKGQNHVYLLIEIIALNLKLLSRFALKCIINAQILSQNNLGFFGILLINLNLLFPHKWNF